MMPPRRAPATLALLGLCAAAACSAGAQSSRAGLSPVQVFGLAEEAGIAGRLKDAFALYDALARDPDADVRAEARFRKGMLLAKGKRYVEAAVEFRALLDERPGATRVRLELARVLALAGDERGARRSLRQAQAAGLPSDVALVVDQFANALHSSRRLGGSLEVSLAPDSNVNRATSARTLDTIIAPLNLSNDARARSGVGLNVAGQIYARVPVAASLAFLPRISARGSLYRASTFDDVSMSALAGLEWQDRKDRVTPSLGPTWRWYGGHPYARTFVGTIDWIHTVDRRTQLSASISASRARYSANALQDGGIFDVGLSFERALDARTGVGTSASVTRQTARDPGFATVSEGSSVFGWRDAGKATFFLSAGIRRLDGDARLFLFADRRREWLYQFSTSATLRQLTFAGFAPLVRAGWERNISSLGIYDYRRVSADIGIVHAF